MKKFLMIGFFLSLQLNLMAVSAGNLKHNSNAFCDVLHYNNNANNLLDQQLLFDSAKLASLIKDMVASIDDIAMIQQVHGTALNLEQNEIVNKHIESLNLIRKKLLHIQNKYQLPLALQKTFNFYRNSMDAHYYQLNPSYESYVLKQCNVSMKETQHAVLYTAGSLLAFSYSASVAGPKVQNNPIIAASSIIACTVAAYSGYCAYKSIHNPSYEFDLI